MGIGSEDRFLMVAYSFKRRFVSPIRVGLGLPVEIDISKTVIPPPPKLQTIRAIGRRRHARPGETVQLYCAMRTKQCFKIGDAQCTRVTPINILVEEHCIGVQPLDRGLLFLDGDKFAQRDGFDDQHDMQRFWLKEHGIGVFCGILIEWEPIA